MNCQQYWEACASDDAAEQAQAELHLAECATCRDERQSLEGSLAQLAEHPPLENRQRQLWLSASIERLQLTAGVTAGLPSSGIGTAGQASSGTHKHGAIAWIVPALATVAILVLVAFVLNSATNETVTSPPRDVPIAQASLPTYSPITIIPLTVALCFGQIDLDLQASEARVEEVSEAVELTEVQRDVRETLQRARHWD